MTREFDKFRQQWLVHVRQYREAVVSSNRCRHQGCDQRHESPTLTRQDLIDRGLLWR